MTPQQLAAAVVCSLNRATQWQPFVDAAMALHGIDTPTRQAAFLANIAHESAHLVWSREIWGPTPQQLRYDRNPAAAWPPTPADKRNALAFDLGNSEPGDGYRYCGRGLIQTTGRHNMRVTGEKLGLDLIAHPELLEQPQHAAMSAGLFWSLHGINKYADAGDFDGVCDVINRGHKTIALGDSNGYLDRVAIWKMAKNVLGVA